MCVGVCLCKNLQVLYKHTSSIIQVVVCIRVTVLCVESVCMLQFLRKSKVSVWTVS